MDSLLRSGDRFDGLVITAVWEDVVEVQEGGKIRCCRKSEILSRRNKAREALGVPGTDEQQG